MKPPDLHPAIPPVAPLPARLPQLDSLRGLAALAVVLAHFHPAQQTATPASLTAAFLWSLRSFAIGNAAVAFFFSLSAFLLTKLARTEYELSGRFSLRHFYVRRCLRIWPLYFAFLLIAAGIYSHAGPSSSGFPIRAEAWSWLKQHAWLYLGFLSNWSLAFSHIGGHVDPSPNALRIVWSIAVEEQFYLLHPLLVLLALNWRRTRGWIVVGVLGLGGIFRLWFVHQPLSSPLDPPSEGGLYYATLTYLDIFLAGAIAGWLAARPSERAGRAWRRRWVGPGLLAGCLVCSRIWDVHLWYPYTFLSVTLYTVMGGLFGGLLLWFAWNSGSPLSRMLGWRPLRLLGLVSYGVYMWHVVSNNLLRAAVFPWLARLPFDADIQIWLQLLLSILSAIGFAAASYLLIERPFLRLKSRFTPMLRMPPPKPNGAAC